MIEILQRLSTWHIMQSDYEEAWDKMIQTYKIKCAFFFSKKEKEKKIKCVFGICLKSHFFFFFYYSAYFCYYSWVPLHFLVLFIGPIVLFQLPFNFIYSTFSKKFSISAI